MKINPDIKKERAHINFDVEELTQILDGGPDVTERRRYVENQGLKDKVFTDGPEYHFLSRPEQYNLGMEKAVHFIKRVRELDLNVVDSRRLRDIAFPNEHPPMGVHDAMFVPALAGQCTPEQANKWLTKAQNYEIIGTYAQTEMGHGTFIRAVETTATYDTSTEQFILNSPTVSSAKWWPGGLGKTSNHVVLMARLLTKGQDCGMQPFIVQIRDLDTHQPLPGIKVGDIGPKMFHEMNDNGFLYFENVRIPRDQMLMKNAQVLKDGTFVKAGKHGKLNYGTMVMVRSMIVSWVAARGLAQATTVAVRYSAVRRQSELKPGAPEPQIMDYQTQQYKLFPQIATSYAIWFAGNDVSNIYFNIQAEIEKGNAEALPELHALTCCLKAYATDLAMFGAEQCRLACGGHGYSKASGFSKIYSNCTASCTYEGENTVMYLQTARYLLKAYAAAQKGQILTPNLSYISEPPKTRSNIDEKLELKQFVLDYKHRAARAINKAGRLYHHLLSKGHPEWKARNMCAVDLAHAAKAHAHSWIVTNFVEHIQNCKASPAVKNILTTLCTLYCAHGIATNSGDFIEDGYLSAGQVHMIEERMLDMLDEIRPNAVALVDAFDFNDHSLGSVLGRFDGLVYENLYQWVQGDPLNKTEVHPSFHKYIKPYREELKQLSAKL